MIISICGLGLLVVSLLALALQRFYSCIPAKELKRLANRGDHLAAALYRPVAYGASMRLLLWIIFGLAFSVGAVMVASGLVPLAAFAVISLAVAGITALQSLRLTVHSARVPVHAAPALSWLLAYLHGPLNSLAGLVGKVRRHDAHSGLYEKEDVLALLRQQREQLDNRISLHDLEVMERAVQFNDRQAADIVTPMSQVKLVNKDDHIGPILLKELHDSGQTSFMVYDTTPERVVGTISLRDAVGAREGGRVADLVRHKLTYVHEDFSLRQVMQAFLYTSQHMVVVINSFEEAVGIVTLDQLLVQLFGENTGDEPMAYEDPVSIAAYKPNKRGDEDRPDEAGADTTPATDPSPEPAGNASFPDATEVVE